MTEWSDEAQQTASRLIAHRALAGAILDWLFRDCDVTDDELCREVSEDMERGWMDATVDA